MQQKNEQAKHIHSNSHSCRFCCAKQGIPDKQKMGKQIAPNILLALFKTMDTKFYLSVEQLTIFIFCSDFVLHNLFQH